MGGGERGRGNCAHGLKLLRHGYFPDAKYKPIQTGVGFYLGLLLGAEERALRRLRKIEQKGVCCIFPGMGWEERDCLHPPPAPLAPSGRAGWYLLPMGQGEGAAARLLFPGL